MVKTIFGYKLFYDIKKAKYGMWETSAKNNSKQEHIFSIFWTSSPKYPLTGRVLAFIIGPLSFMIAIRK